MPSSTPPPFDGTIPTEILTAMSPADWLALVTPDPDGPLSPCCAEISDLRDDIVMLLRLFTPTQAALVCRQLTSSHAHDDPGPDTPIGRLAAALTSWLDGTWPEWRAWQPPTAEELAAFEAGAHLGVAAPARPVPRDQWAARLQAALDVLAVSPGDGEEAAEAWLKEVHATLGQALTAGVPAGVVLALREARTHLLRAALTEQPRR